MAYIRDRHELLTGCQDASPWSPKVDIQQDFIMVYGTDPGMPDRIRKYREKGYVIHLMAGSAWGNYQDYLDGQWDGVNHWDESQTDRRGNPILHGINVPYICPTLSFGCYLAEKLRPAVDAGTEAIHLEEPEFWDEGGYGEAFKREYKAFYGEDWQPPHESVESRYKASALKVYLYRRLVAQVSREIKNYAREQYNREIKFYIPTHSLVNYTQWKILSPEGTLLDVPTVDGCIAQVWTGTSRVGNVYKGRYAERTFETAFLEYGIMQELVRGTGRRMWFLHDPVEDDPEYTWEDFRKNYLKTVVASLLHPAIHHYEVVTWPTRVMTGMYPKKRLFSLGLQPGENMEGAKAIPADYAELICALSQTLGDMDQKEAHFTGKAPRMGIFMADSGLYQRTFPDSVTHSPGGVDALNDAFISFKLRRLQGENVEDECSELLSRIECDEGLYNDYVTSGPFPHFFGMAMPLLKAGVPLRPVQLENVGRYDHYLKDYDTLLVSYEFIKPREESYHLALKEWVEEGGTLIYVGDHTDPYHQAHGWWNTGENHYPTPAHHLLETFGIAADAPRGVYPAGRGRVAVYPLSPGRITLTPDAAQCWLQFVLQAACPDFVPTHVLDMQRGVYRIACVMDESISDAPYTIEGTFADMLDNDFALLRNRTLKPGENALLFDLDAIRDEHLRIIGTSARIFALDETEGGIRIQCKAASDIMVRMRLKVPGKVTLLSVKDENGPVENAACTWDEATSTVLISFPSTNSMTDIRLM